MVKRLTDWATSSFRNFLIWTIIVFSVSFIFSLALAALTGAEQ